MPPRKSKPVKAAPVEASPQTSSPDTHLATPAVNTRSNGYLISQALQNPIAVGRKLLFDREHYWLVAGALAVLNLAFGFVIIQKVAYTKIDWPAYMQQVDMFLSGERDYSRIEGETGPLVYPALHLYIYSALHEWLPAHARERPAQYLWLLVELVTFLLVATIYFLAGRTRHIPQWLLVPMVLSKRSHSIYLLRLFNDPLAMVIFYASVVMFMLGQGKIGSLIYSLALGVKMNILLFLPGLIVIMFQYRGFFGVVDSLIIVAFVQVGLGSLYFFEDFTQLGIYFKSAFDFQREFLYKWTVNWAFVPEHIFLSKRFAQALLAAHVLLLVAFGMYRWSPVPGGTTEVLKKGLWNLRAMFKPPVHPSAFSTSHIPFILFSSNLIGMVCARSLHYQFHSWYFHQLPLLLYLGAGWDQTAVIIGTMLCLERAWGTYPATANSSLLMLGMHIAMLAGLWVKGPRPPAPLADRAR